MWNALSERPEFPVALMFVLISFFILLAIVADRAIGAWRGHQQAKIDADLKMEMIAQGMSAEDIERVLSAKMTAAGRTAVKRSISAAAH
jgi:hypothetical protein